MARWNIVRSDGDEVAIGDLTMANAKAVEVTNEPAVDTVSDGSATGESNDDESPGENAEGEVGGVEASPPTDTHQDPGEAAPVADEGGSSNDDSAAEGDAASTATDEPVAAADESNNDDVPTADALTPPSGEEVKDDQGNESVSPAASLDPNSSTDSGGDMAEVAQSDSDSETDTATIGSEYHH